MRCLHDEEATIKICIQPNLTFVTLTLPLSEYSPYSRCVVDRFAFLFVCQGQNTKYIAGQSASRADLRNFCQLFVSFVLSQYSILLSQYSPYIKVCADISNCTNFCNFLPTLSIFCMESIFTIYQGVCWHFQLHGLHSFWQ